MLEHATEEEKKLYRELFHVCPECGHTVPPADCKNITEWLLRNDPLFRRAYDLGRYEERNQDRTRQRQPRERKPLNIE
jgi:hypothetical protein